MTGRVMDDDEKDTPWRRIGMGKWSWHAMKCRAAANDWRARGNGEHAQEFEDAARMADRLAEQIAEHGGR